MYANLSVSFEYDSLYVKMMRVKTLVSSKSKFVKKWKKEAKIIEETIDCNNNVVFTQPKLTILVRETLLPGVPEISCAL